MGGQPMQNPSGNLDSRPRCSEPASSPIIVVGAPGSAPLASVVGRAPAMTEFRQVEALHEDRSTTDEDD